MSDFGPKTAFKIVDGIRDKVMGGQLKTGDQIRAELKQSIASLLQQRGGGSELALGDAKPAVLLVVGVNGGGKTTTIGKLANKFGSGGAKVVLAAGDTFRAAAAEQLGEWARRAGAELVRGESDKARPDTVLFQAVESAVRSGADLVLCDTSGRLHTNWSLMDELAKCKRSIGKALPGAPHEVGGRAGGRRLARGAGAECWEWGLVLQHAGLQQHRQQPCLPLHLAASPSYRPTAPAMPACLLCPPACLPALPLQVLLVLDGTTGLNMLNQAKEFNETVQLSGLILTKLDGTARGGAVVSAERGGSPASVAAFCPASLRLHLHLLLQGLPHLWRLFAAAVLHAALLPELAWLCVGAIFAALAASQTAPPSPALPFPPLRPAGQRGG